jgi:hypothetical protein
MSRPPGRAAAAQAASPLQGQRPAPRPGAGLRFPAAAGMSGNVATPKAIQRLVDAVGGPEKLSPAAVAELTHGASGSAGGRVARLSARISWLADTAAGWTPGADRDDWRPVSPQPAGAPAEERKAAFSAMNGVLQRQFPRKAKEYAKLTSDTARHLGPRAPCSAARQRRARRAPVRREASRGEKVGTDVGQAGVGSRQSGG